MIDVRPTGRVTDREIRERCRAHLRRIGCANTLVLERLISVSSCHGVYETLYRSREFVVVGHERAETTIGPKRFPTTRWVAIWALA